MDLRQLAYFTGVCEHGSIAGAARALHMAQPALSRQMSALEEELGTPLFTRLPRGIELTRAGEALKERALSLLAQASALPGQVREAAHGLTGCLRLAVAPSYAGLPAFVQALQRMQATAPQVQISVETLHSSEQLERLRLRQLDAALVLWRSPLDPGFSGRTIHRDAMVLALPRDWPEARQRRALHLADMGAKPLLMFPRERSPSHYDTVVQALKTAGVKPRRFGVSIADSQTTLSMVASGLGYAVSASFCEAHWSGSVTFRQAEDLDIPLFLELVWREGEGDALVRHFLTMWD